MQVLKIKNNIYCPYCGIDLRPLKRPDQKGAEHVIGRRFVPKGYLDGAWNLVLDACGTCNQLKARLEDSVSAMSHLTFLPTEDMPDEVRQDLMRKLDLQGGRGAGHPETGKQIAFSTTEHTFKTMLGCAELTFTLMAPPQHLETEMQLVKMQIQAFYYVVSNSDPRNVDNNAPIFTDSAVICPGEHVLPLAIVRRSDWGNLIVQELAKRTRSWQIHWVINTARGYFRVEMRPSPTENHPKIVFWAVEWNKNVRILGVIRASKISHPIERDLPVPEISWISPDIGLRVETSLNEHDDLLFRLEPHVD